MAAADAREWWASGKVLCRATPHAVSVSLPVVIKAVVFFYKNANRDDAIASLTALRDLYNEMRDVKIDQVDLDHIDASAVEVRELPPPDQFFDDMKRPSDHNDYLYAGLFLSSRLDIDAPRIHI
ncbi:hypothetical protein GC176_25030 [bacterium]|nr:hypothetical protein [bacterium]